MMYAFVDAWSMTCNVDSRASSAKERFPCFAAQRVPRDTVNGGARLHAPAF